MVASSAEKAECKGSKYEEHPCRHLWHSEWHREWKAMDKNVPSSVRPEGVSHKERMPTELQFGFQPGSKEDGTLKPLQQGHGPERELPKPVSKDCTPLWHLC